MNLAVKWNTIEICKYNCHFYQPTQDLVPFTQALNSPDNSINSNWHLPLITRRVKMCWTQRSILRGRAFVIMPMATHKLHPLSSHRRIRWKMMHMYSRHKGRIFKTLLVWGSSDAISCSSSLHFLCFQTLCHSLCSLFEWFKMQPKLRNLRHQYNVMWHFDRAIWRPFFGTK